MVSPTSVTKLQIFSMKMVRDGKGQDAALRQEPQWWIGQHWPTVAHGDAREAAGDPCFVTLLPLSDYLVGRDSASFLITT